MNPIQSELSKAANFIQGRSVVDNEANQWSAYNVAQRRRANAGTGSNAKNRALEKGIEKAYGADSKVKVFGSPYKK